jgi:hypothetical protein
MSTTSQDLRNAYERLYSEVSLLTFKWLTYKELFSGDEQRIRLLDRTARSFFQVYHDTLLSDILLSFSRIADKPKSHKGARISLRRLLIHLDSNVNPAFAAKFKALVDKAEQDCDPFRKHRNNELGHLNMNTILNSSLYPLPDLTIGQIDDALKNIQTSMTTYSQSMFNESHMFEPMQALRGPSSLIFYLERGVRCVDENHESQVRN